jgi:L-Ala-D/L-Glu epimerase
MLRTVTTGVEQRALHTPFRISRGTRNAIDLAVVTIARDGVVGRGEGSVTARYGESVESVAEQLRAIGDAIVEGAGRDDLRALMAPGSARNAVDCALWDLEAKLGAVAPPVAIRPVHTALTLGIDTPEAMAAAARKIRGAAAAMAGRRRERGVDHGPGRSAPAHARGARCRISRTAPAGR